MPRPQHRGKQKRFYSGRKKRHAVKNVIIVGQRKVLWCSPTVPARCHDKTVADRARLRLPEQVVLLGDSGFEGLEAGQAGVPAVASRVGGVEEIVCDGRTWWLFESGNRAHAARILAGLAANSSAINTAGMEASQRIAGQFALSKMVAKYQELYSSVRRHAH